MTRDIDQHVFYGDGKIVTPLLQEEYTKFP